ncbi:muscarinic acetylcholine receptor M3 [Clupea harengus]|uniref:Muscarinic acetylcholine receptor n=1 Tax=Clupea harengus TaxID=7950 RepID=A0A6P3VEC6_CLUHA|nr:muscarinic acetylcholine receptor M3 [Clupea harengus]
MVSFKLNKALQTVNNYYLLSLACADLTIGTLSMNLYTTYLIMDTWALGNWACDLWLAIDYVASNASVMNLLVISFDRYFSVMQPLTYRAKRTTKRAITMICSAWSISFVLWAPAILFWQFIVGERTVPPGECYIQFLSEPIITFCTAIAAFYLPVSIMTFLFWKIYQQTQNRSKDLAGMSAGNKKKPEPVPQTGSSKNSNTDLNQPAQNSPGKKPRGWRRFLSLGRGEKACSGEEPENTSGEGKNNNDTEACIDQSASDDDKMAKPAASKAKTPISKPKKQANENKAAQTLSAILCVFIITWTPYNVMVLVSTFCDDCIPETLWALGYWLCYVNSTINPMCYALCNKNFRDTFKLLLLCQWDSKKQNKPQFQQRQAGQRNK